MRLVLSVGNKILDSLKIDPIRAKDNDYIKSLCRLLVVKHELTILAHQEEPNFYLEVVSRPGQETQ